MIQSLSQMAITPARIHISTHTAKVGSHVGRSVAHSTAAHSFAHTVSQMAMRAAMYRVMWHLPMWALLLIIVIAGVVMYRTTLR